MGRGHCAAAISHPVERLCPPGGTSMLSILRRLSASIQKSAQRDSRRRKSRPNYRPSFDTLEDRCVPTTFTVTSNADSGANTLRADLAAAMNGDTINFNVTSPITITSGQLTVATNVTIQGPGASLLTIMGNGTSRIFSVSTGVTATIAG